MSYSFKECLLLCAITVCSAPAWSGTTTPIFAIVDRAPYSAGETISSAFGFSDPSGTHWVGSSSEGTSAASVWKLRAYSQDQFLGTDKTSYPLISNSKRNLINAVATKNQLVAAIGTSASGNLSEGYARISYDRGQTWNELIRYSCGSGRTTHFISADFLDEKNIFISGFCVDLTGTSRWFVRKGSFDDAEMQWFWSTSDQLVGRLGVNNAGAQMLASIAGELIVSGTVQNEVTSAVLVRSSLDKGKTWRTVSTPLATPENIRIHRLAQVSGTLYLAASTGPDADSHNVLKIFQSADSGRTWTVLHDWTLNGSTLEGRIDFLIRPNEIVIVGSHILAFTGATNAWLKRSIDGGLSWSTYAVAGEFEAGCRFTGLHQFGSSAILVSGTDRMTTGEDRITYRTFKPR